MSLIASVELTTTHARVVMRHAITGAVQTTQDAAWDPMRPHLVVAALRAQLPTPTRIGLVVGREFLRTAAVTLPPVSAEHRRAMLALEPDRYFLGATAATTVALEVPSSGASNLAFAIDTAQITSWIDAFGEWAPVDGVVAAADPGDDASVRAPVDTAEPFQLMPPLLLAARRRRRQLQIGMALFMVCAAAAILLVSVDRARERHLDALDVAVARQQALTAPAQGDLDRLMQLAQSRDAAVTLLASRGDPTAVLAAISTVLPRSATIMRVRMTEGGWQIDGSASDAAAVIRAFEQDPRFADVRVLTATTRFEDQGRARESFSLGFHAAP